MRRNGVVHGGGPEKPLLSRVVAAERPKPTTDVADSRLTLAGVPMMGSATPEETLQVFLKFSPE
jgi:hypothetical protein